MSVPQGESRGASSLTAAGMLGTRPPTRRSTRRSYTTVPRKASSKAGKHRPRQPPHRTGLDVADVAGSSFVVHAMATVTPQRTFAWPESLSSSMSWPPSRQHVAGISFIAHVETPAGLVLPALANPRHCRFPSAFQRGWRGRCHWTEQHRAWSSLR